MLATLRQHLGMDDHRRQPYPKRRSLAFAGTGRLNRSAVHLDDVTNDGETKTQATSLAGGARFGLAEALEHIGEKIRRDALAGVTDDDFRVRIHPLQANLHASMFWRELHGVRDEVPDHLLQAARVA